MEEDPQNSMDSADIDIQEFPDLHAIGHRRVDKWRNQKSFDSEAEQNIDGQYPKVTDQ